MGMLSQKGEDQRPAVERALESATGLKPGTWRAVEALSLLAVEAKGTLEAGRILQPAHQAAERLSSGTWRGALPGRNHRRTHVAAPGDRWRSDADAARVDLAARSERLVRGQCRERRVD